MRTLGLPAATIVMLVAGVILLASGCGADNQTNSDTTSATGDGVTYRGTSLAELDSDASARQIEAAGDKMCGTRGYTVTVDDNWRRLFVVCGATHEPLP